MSRIVLNVHEAYEMMVENGYTGSKTNIWGFLGNVRNTQALVEAGRKTPTLLRNDHNQNKYVDLKDLAHFINVVLAGGELVVSDLIIEATDNVRNKFVEECRRRGMPEHKLSGRDFERYLDRYYPYE